MYVVTSNGIVHADHTTAWPKYTVFSSAKCRQTMDSADNLEFASSGTNKPLNY